MGEMKKQYEKRINIFIEEELLLKLDAFADKKRWKRSFVVREAIKFYLEKINE